MIVVLGRKSLLLDLIEKASAWRWPFSIFIFVVLGGGSWLLIACLLALISIREKELRARHIHDVWDRSQVLVGDLCGQHRGYQRYHHVQPYVPSQMVMSEFWGWIWICAGLLVAKHAKHPHPVRESKHWISKLLGWSIPLDWAKVHRQGEIVAHRY